MSWVFTISYERGQTFLQKELHSAPRCGKLETQGGKLLCPMCGQPTMYKILPTTALSDFPLYCKHCRRETIVSLNKSQNQSQSQSQSQSHRASASARTRARVSAD